MTFQHVFAQVHTLFIAWTCKRDHRAVCTGKLVVGGCSDGGGWLATWRVLARNQCSRLIDGLVDDWLVGWSMVWFLVGCLSQI